MDLHDSRIELVRRYLANPCGRTELSGSIGKQPHAAYPTLKPPT
jgi:hypothetical protein